MRFFKMLTLVGSAVLAISSLSAKADTVVSCAWATDSQSGSYGYMTYNQSCRTSSTNTVIATRQIKTDPTKPEPTCSISTISGYYYTGTCLNPTIYSSSSTGGGSGGTTPTPTTKVVNGVTIPYTATVWMQGTCYSWGCQTPSQTCYNQYRGSFAMAPYPSQNYVCYTN